MFPHKLAKHDQPLLKTKKDLLLLLKGVLQIWDQTGLQKQTADHTPRVTLLALAITGQENFLDHKPYPGLVLTYIMVGSAHGKSN
jgi:hypothetical protein